MVGVKMKDCQGKVTRALNLTFHWAQSRLIQISFFQKNSSKCMKFDDRFKWCGAALPGQNLNFSLKKFHIAHKIFCYKKAWKNLY